MTAPGVQTHITVFVDGATRTRVHVLAECDSVVVHLGEISDVAMHLDRDGITLLAGAMTRARAALDAAQDETSPRSAPQPSE